MIFTALLGNPVEHSVSPIMYDWFAKQIGIEYAHLKILVQDAESLSETLDHLLALGCSGVNITLPYKRTVLPFLDEIEKDARAMGAVNTIVFCDGKRIGSNTDGLGARRAIERHLRPITSQDHIAILGSGGAARAIIYSLSERMSHITVLARDRAEGAQLIDDFVDMGRPLPRLCGFSEAEIVDELSKADFIINATPLGMYPNVQTSPISDTIFEKVFHTHLSRTWYAFDAVFNPVETVFLRQAAIGGAQTCSGIWMMIYQGQDAFLRWTGLGVYDVHLEPLFDLLHRELTYRYATSKQTR